MRPIHLLTLACLPALLRAQSPGGVSTNLSVWYKADLNVTGNPVSSWGTSGGSAAGYNLTQGTPANRPGLTAGSTNYKRYNYNPRIDFVVASSTRLENTGTAPNLYNATGSAFVVTDQNPAGGNGTAFSYSANLANQRIQIKPSFRIQTSTGVNGYTADWSPPTEYSNTSASIIQVSGLGASATHRLNSVAMACSNCGLPLYNPAIVTGLRVGRNGGGGEYVDCDLGEIILYSGALTAAEINRVESYLAIKYGITRGGNTGTSATYNYVNSAGTVIWNKTTNAGYNNDIAGIGRDDNSALVQKQSISVNNNESVSMGLVSIDASNAANANTFSSNNSFVMWGNDGGAQQTVWSDAGCFNSLPSGVQARIQRKWKAQVTNFTQTVTIGFETSALVNYTPLTNLRLLVDNDGSDWTNATAYSGAVLDGSRVEFPGITLSSGTPYFTLATINTVTTPLPVELLDFTAAPAGSIVDLRWHTATETGSDRFDVERSADGTLFERIATMPALGNSNTLHEYRLPDAAPLAGTSYYRLRQMDLDGQSAVSSTVSVTMDALAPGPDLLVDALNGIATVAGYQQAVHGPITLYDLRGARLPLDGHRSSQGIIDTQALPRGVYVVAVADRTWRLVVEH